MCRFQGGLTLPATLSGIERVVLTSSHTALSVQNLRRRPYLHSSVVRLLVGPRPPTVIRILGTLCYWTAAPKLHTLNCPSEDDYWTISDLLAGAVSKSV
jgi:hypothetical protein